MWDRILMPSPHFFMFMYYITDENFKLYLLHRSIHESPRWLLSKGRTAEGEEILHFIGDVNHKELPEKLGIRSQNKPQDHVSLKQSFPLLKMFLCVKFTH